MTGRQTWDFGSRTMAQGRRFRRVMDLLYAQGSATVDELVEILGVSRMTVHRDLDELDSRGVLSKVRGGATVQRTNQFESTWDYRLSLMIEAKEAIAQRALEFVEPRCSLMIDASTTGHILSRLLPQRAPITVVSNSLPTINELAGVEGIEVNSLGGVYNAHFRAFLGESTEQAARAFRTDVAFISMAAAAGGIACHSSSEAMRADRALFEAARRRILMLDSSKLGQSALHVFGPVADFDVVIVDSGAAPEEVAALSGLDVELVIAQVPVGTEKGAAASA